MNSSHHGNSIVKMKMAKSDKNVTPNGFKNDFIQNSNMLINYNHMPGMRNNYNIHNVNSIPNINEHNSQNLNNMRIPNSNRLWRANSHNKVSDYSNINNQNLIDSSRNFKKTASFNSIKEELHNQNNENENKNEEELFFSSKSDYSITEEEFKYDNLNDRNSFALCVSVKLINKEEFIYITKNDEVMTTAKLFVSKHKLNENLIGPIAESIQQALNSIDMILDSCLTETDRKSIDEIKKFYSEQQEENFNKSEVMYDTDYEKNNNLNNLFILTPEEEKKIERLNISR
jgi:hypothetical protein